MVHGKSPRNVRPLPEVDSLVALFNNVLRIWQGTGLFFSGNPVGRVCRSLTV